MWRKAPGSLLRQRSLFAALTLGAFLVVVSSTAYALFLSASGSALVSSEIADPTVTRYGAGITYTVTNVRLAQESPDGHGLLIDRRRQLFAQALGARPELDPVVEEVMGYEVGVTLPGGRVTSFGPLSGVLFSGTQVLDHVDILSGRDGPGAWLPDYIAKPLHAGPGDQVELHFGRSVAAVTVDGVYRSLYAEPSTGYWRTWYEQIYPCPPDCAPPPQQILVDRQQLLDLSKLLGTPRARFAITAPVRDDPPLTIGEARDLAGFAEHFNEQVTSRPAFRTIFPCCGRLFLGTGHTMSTALQDAIPGVVRIVEQRESAVQGPIQVLFLIGLAIAFGVVAAAGVFSFTSRRVDAGVLAVRGWGPGRIAVKAMLESILPCTSGAIAGFVVATGTIAWLGPDGRVESSVRVASSIGAVGATLVVIALVGVVSGLSFASHHEPRPGAARVVLFIPWEVVSLVGAYVMQGRLHAEGGVLGTEVGRPAPAVFLFPLLLALGVAIIAARVMAFALSRRHAGDERRVSPWYLAVRRLASASKLAALFVVTASVAMAVFIASQSMVSSLRATVEAKTKVFVGSDVELRVGRDTVVPPDLGFPATIATRSRQAGFFPNSDLQFDLLAIDPATFEGAAYWNSAFSDRSEADLMDLLTAPSGERLPVVMANGTGPAPTSLVIEQQTVPIEVVAQASSVPGTSSDRPVFVVADERLHAAFAGKLDPLNTPEATREMWIRGPTDEVVAAASAAHIDSYLTITADQVADIPFIKAAIDTFLVLDVLGVVSFILVLVVAIVYLQARQRSRIVSTALSGRMGLPPGTMRRSLVLELSLLLSASLAVGATTGAVGAYIVIPYLDPLPTIPPAPISVMPVTAFVLAVVGLALAALAGGRSAGRPARDVRLGEVLRVAE